MRKYVFLLAAVCGTYSSRGIDEFLGVCIFGTHVVITFLDLKGPGSKLSGQDRFETDVESQG